MENYVIVNGFDWGKWQKENIGERIEYTGQEICRKRVPGQEIRVPEIRGSITDTFGDINPEREDQGANIPAKENPLKRNHIPKYDYQQELKEKDACQFLF
jgi:hypothetical protein